MNIRLIPLNSIVVIDNKHYKRVPDIKKRMSGFGMQTNSKFINIHNKRDIKLFWRGVEVIKINDKYKLLTITL